MTMTTGISTNTLILIALRHHSEIHVLSWETDRLWGKAFLLVLGASSVFFKYHTSREKKSVEVLGASSVFFKYHTREIHCLSLFILFVLLMWWTSVDMEVLFCTSNSTYNTVPNAVYLLEVSLVFLQHWHSKHWLLELPIGLRTIGSFPALLKMFCVMMCSIV